MYICKSHFQRARPIIFASLVGGIGDVKFPVTGRHFSSKILSSRIIKLGICNFPFISVLNHFYIFFRSFCLISPPHTARYTPSVLWCRFLQKKKRMHQKTGPHTPNFSSATQNRLKCEMCHLRQWHRLGALCCTLSWAALGSRGRLACSSALRRSQWDTWLCSFSTTG